MYDTVTELSWAVDIRTHGIVNVIENVLNKTWTPSEAQGREVPVPKVEEDCVVRIMITGLIQDLTKWTVGMLQLGVRQLPLVEAGYKCL